ncbi:MAG: hypothetical protein ACOCZ8_02475 [Bacteroidota bacterium]
MKFTQNQLENHHFAKSQQALNHLFMKHILSLLAIIALAVSLLQAQNVGIGTTSPSQKLDVDGQVRFRAGAADGYILRSDANGVGTWTDPATLNDLDWLVNGNDQVAQTTGNVGINTTAPLNKFEVLGISGPGATTLIINQPNSLVNRTGTSPGGNDLRQRFTSGTGGLLQSMEIMTGAFNDGNTFQLELHSGDLPTGSSLVATSTIGTSATDSWRTVSFATQPVIVPGQTYTVRLVAISGPISWDFRAATANPKYINGASSSGGFSLRVEAQSVDFSSFSVTETGNVGIGTTAPTAALDVDGALRFRTGATDGYVLTSDASGNASWTDPATLSDGDWTVSGNDQYSAVSGNVGIGTTSPGSRLDIRATGDGASLLRLNTDRAWSFRQRSTGATTELQLLSEVDSKIFAISSNDGTDIARFFASSTDNNASIRFLEDGGTFLAPGVLEDAAFQTWTNVMAGTSGAYTALPTPMSTTVTTTAANSIIIADATISRIQHDDADCNTILGLFINGVEVCRVNTGNSRSWGYDSPSLHGMRNVTAGTHTIEVRYATQCGGSINWTGNADGEQFRTLRAQAFVAP